MEDIVRKIIHDQARGVIIVPLWENTSWFQRLRKVTVKWWDLPHDVQLYQSDQGIRYPQRDWRTRAIVFDGSVIPRYEICHLETYHPRTGFLEKRELQPLDSGDFQGHSDSEDYLGYDSDDS